MPWTGLFALTEALPLQGPSVLDPEAAQKHLEQHLEWEERRLMRHCYASLGVMFLGGTMSLLIGWFWLFLAAAAVSFYILLTEKRRWRASQRQPPAWIIQALANWLMAQQDKDRAIRSVRNMEGSLDWQRLVDQASRYTNSNHG